MLDALAKVIMETALLTDDEKVTRVHYRKERGRGLRQDINRIQQRGSDSRRHRADAQSCRGKPRGKSIWRSQGPEAGAGDDSGRERHASGQASASRSCRKLPESVRCWPATRVTNLLGTFSSSLNRPIESELSPPCNPRPRLQTTRAYPSSIVRHRARRRWQVESSRRSCCQTCECS